MSPEIPKKEYQWPQIEHINVLAKKILKKSKEEAKMRLRIDNISKMSKCVFAIKCHKIWIFHLFCFFSASSQLIKILINELNQSEDFSRSIVKMLQSVIYEYDGYNDCVVRATLAYSVVHEPCLLLTLQILRK